MIVDGQIVPFEITLNLIKKAMIKAGWGERKFLIDGLPKNSEN
jgi:hypothetical protein